ncbi:MAG: hypothetical protein KJO80_04980 [Gammaproteobacteria bacterium]|nr:hypothetical protein [Gammaproteobacteria bacterium]NNK98311.1 hypothetical protein [Xanthomonadales bacterium]
MSGASSLSHDGTLGRELAVPQEETNFDKDSTRQTVTSEAGVLDIDLSALGSHEPSFGRLRARRRKKQTTGSGEQYVTDLFNCISCQFTRGNACPVFLSTDLAFKQVSLESQENAKPGKSHPD